MVRWVNALETVGFVRVAGPFAARTEAWSAAQAIVEEVSLEAPVELIGDFVIAPMGGPPSRDFQTLHIDFGLPLLPVVPTDVARFTALYIGEERAPSNAVTRLVPLAALSTRHQWPAREELVRRFASYAHTHGARDDHAGYLEGSLARIVEAALGERSVLPSVKTQPDFLCGNEFGSLAAEVEFFAERDVDLASIQIDVRLRPGELLVFDNLALAHGRRGTRFPGELNQRVFGHPALAVEEQLRLRDQALEAFGAPRAVRSAAA